MKSPLLARVYNVYTQTSRASVYASLRTLCEPYNNGYIRRLNQILNRILIILVNEKKKRILQGKIKTIQYVNSRE